MFLTEKKWQQRSTIYLGPAGLRIRNNQQWYNWQSLGSWNNCHWGGGSHSEEYERSWVTIVRL